MTDVQLGGLEALERENQYHMMALVGIEPVPSRTAAERTDRSTTDATSVCQI